MTRRLSGFRRAVAQGQGAVRVEGQHGLKGAQAAQRRAPVGEHLLDAATVAATFKRSPMASVQAGLDALEDIGRGHHEAGQYRRLD